MRQTAARLNRAWLTVIGVVLLLAGLAVVLIGTGLLQPASRAVGLELTKPAPSNRLFGSATASAFSLTWVVVVTAVVGVVLGLLGLAWLIAQIPRANQAKPFRLHDEADTGLTRCAPSVLTDAVEAQIKALPGVQAASAVLRGTAQRPDLTIKVTASDRTNVPALLETLQNQVAVDFGQALDTQLQRLGIQVEIDAVKTKADRITV
ncbi:MAG TPA: hypothetical protein VIT20_04870 [Propionibacteriaceae bacterium]